MRLFTIILISFGFSFQSISQQEFSDDYETVIIHTDSREKLSGDILWFKLYLTNNPYRPQSLSSIAYVELVDSSDQILTRIKLRCQNGFANGEILLPQSLPTMTYKLRAYTRWMNNFTDLPYPELNIHIHNINDGHASIDRNAQSFYKKYNDAHLSISTQAYSFKAGDEIKISIANKARDSKWVNFSLSVHEYRLREEIDINQIQEAYSSIPIFLRKEAVIYPPSSYTLTPIYFDSILISNKNLTVNYKGALVKNENFIQRQLDEHFSKTSFLGEPELMALEADISYSIEEYQMLSDLNEFIREVIPHIKISKKNKVREIRIRNSELSQNTYYYKKPPLVIIDGYIQPDIETVLSLPISNIKSIDVAWSGTTINKSQIFGLADNGFIFIHTKSPKTLSGQTFLFNDFFVPSHFTVTKPFHQINDAVPDFRKLLFWSPTNTINNNSLDFKFQAADLLGKYVIEVVGINNQGELISTHQFIEVTK